MAKTIGIIKMETAKEMAASGIVPRNFADHNGVGNGY
jgi:hypothetical protein